MTGENLPALPYVDFIFQELAARNPNVAQAWSRHMHWGYWEDPDQADLSAAGYEAAADAMTLAHLRDVSLHPGMHVADIGCGLGGTMGLLDQRFEGLRLTGVNIDPRQIDYARQMLQGPAGVSSGQNDIDFIVGDACELPFENASLDLVLSIECIFHFPSRKKYFQELARVLKPGGRVVISDFVAKGWGIPAVILLYLPFQKGVRRSYGDAGMPPTRSLYRRLAEGHGFRSVSLNDVTSNTLPNYRALPPLVRGTPVENDFNAGLKFLEIVTKLGLYTYDLFTFERA